MNPERHDRTRVLEAIERCFTRTTIDGLLYKHGVPEQYLGGSSKKELLLGVFRGLEAAQQDDRLAAFIEDAVNQLPIGEKSKLGSDFTDDDGESDTASPAESARETFSPDPRARDESNLPRRDPPAFIAVRPPPAAAAEEFHTSYPFPINIAVREWPKVRSAPWSFFACTVAGVVLGAFAVYALYQLFVIPGKDATIQQLSLRPESLPAQQEAQRMEIQALRAELKEKTARNSARLAGAWPPLSDAQIEVWTKALQNRGIKSFTVYWGQSVDAVEFYRSLRKVGEQAGFEVLPGSGNADRPVIQVGTVPKHPAGPILLKLFAEYAPKYPLKLEEYPHEKEGNVDLFIGEKP
jgi:hypothetical protein